ncbi:MULTISPECIES: ROK family transcriptional regulator [unclassified Nocardioides]|uniref:ROK family transcriptional regulator n=1 Tax=unclassified Nocardioides TaxID=2615069 RepID=UPI0009F12BC0|nr:MULTISPECIES: ROK family transcriptional regulator [unclassified Nocardioides]GAW49441.1 ROK family protein [Nocardioides sp. PD653-B2]GAW55045.1 ROK family protein [Nocardioides sp. PD653]
MPTPTGVGTEELRRANLRAILQTVHTRGPTTRAVLTRELGLNRSTIGALTFELQSLGLVTEQTSAVGGRSGRPSHLVVPCPDNVVVAVDVGVDRVAVALVGLGGDVLDRRDRGHQRGEHDVAHVVESVAQMIEDCLAAVPSKRCLGIGVAVPGAVRTGDGLVRFAPNLGWVEEPFTELLANRLGRPVSTGNDANLGVLAEHIRGVAVGYSDVAYLSASVGIGGGFLVGGVPLTGARGYAGEVGHMQVDSLGPECRCGSVGCWEMKVGENVLLRRAGRLPGGGPPAIAEVIASARDGEARAAAAVDEVAEWCGVGIRAIVNLFNPEIVVLGGVLSQVWSAASDRVDEALSRSTLISPRNDVEIRSARLEDDSPLIGAAELAFAPVLEHPQMVPQAV